VINLEHLTRLIDSLESSDDIRPNTKPASSEGTIFIGSGDSLSSGILATAFGHRAFSSGDLTWTGTLPFGTQTVVGISHSGSSGATVRAIRLAREVGARTIAITSNPASPLAAEADEIQVVPTLAIDEIVPCAGHLMLGLGVAAVCGVDTAAASSELARMIAAHRGTIQTAVEALPASPPNGISILTLPELRGAGDFWALKLIEATGFTVRTVALEESGHVDYFIGPDSHLVLQLVGAAGRDRFERLAAALVSTGQTVHPVYIGGRTHGSGTHGSGTHGSGTHGSGTHGSGTHAAPSVHPVCIGGRATEDMRAAVLVEIAGAAIGTLVAEAAAAKWDRPPFRGGAVNMDARHIKLDGEPCSA